MTVFEEIKARASGKELEQMLLDHCDQVIQDYKFNKPISDEEMNERRELLSEILIEIDHQERELAQAKERINLILKPKKREMKGILAEIRNNHQEAIENVFVYLDHELRRAFYVDNQGNVVHSRALRAEERQGRLRAMND